MRPWQRKNKFVRRGDSVLERFPASDQVVDIGNCQTETKSIIKKVSRKNKDGAGSDSDKESVASSQFLEQLLECDRLEVRQNIVGSPLPKCFTSVRNFLADNNVQPLPHSSIQRKTFQVTRLAFKSAVLDKSPQIQNYHRNNDKNPLITYSMTDLPDKLTKYKMDYLVSRGYEREELKRINERFSTYIQHVRQLSDISNKVDSSAFLKSIKILEEEINSLKNLYENELDKLRSEIDDVNKEKNSCQLQYSKTVHTASELEDRLSVEMDRNRKLNDELNNYQRQIAGLESEVNDAKSAANQSLVEMDKLQRNVENLTRENNTWKHRFEHEELARLEDQEKVQQLIQKIEFNDQVHTEQARELQERLESSADTILKLEAKIRDLGKSDTNVSEVLKQVREASDVELRKYQVESEEQQTRTMSILKNHMDQDKETINRLSSDKNQLQTLVGELQSKKRSFEGQISALEQQKGSLEDLVNEERRRAVDQTKLLESKLQDLEDALFTKIQEANSARDANLPLKTEIETLKVLLEEEERRLRIPLTSPMIYTTTGTTTTNFNTNNYTNGFTHPVPPPQPFTSLSSGKFPVKPYSPKLLSQSFNGNLTSTFPNDISYPYQSSYEPVANDTTPLFDGDFGSPEVLPTDQYYYETTPSMSRMQCGQNSACDVRPIGLVRAKSAPAQPHGVRLVPTSLGQGQDYFDEMFKDLAQDTLQPKLQPTTCPLDRTLPSTYHDYTVATASSTGNIKILEVHQDGKFIRLVNEGPKDVEFGGYMLQQNVGGHPIAVYRFPPRTKFAGNTTITVWSGMTDPIKHQPPTDYVWKEQQKWGTGPECTTILCKPNGQAVAWTTAAHRFTQNNYGKGNGQQTPEQAESLGEEENLTELPLETKQDPVYLRREKQQPPSLVPQKHPHGTSPAVPTHPHGTNPVVFTHDNGVKSYTQGGVASYRTPTRSQSRPDVIMDAPVQRVGSSPVRKSASQQQPTLKGNGILNNKPAGKIRFGPPSPFLLPLQQEFTQSCNGSRNTTLVHFTA
ncbi:uncharacterized protein LOC126825380 isoform X2 [Patella vulgata]|uniref:uncharacterized protein LOC126825380 isoform X2 n=1 Tax=Patella vulgata TaxID=6465 RepID=UPI00218088C7|nr:uncharacterized protein LOC126825380 isoform X2 [Patella vulgata]